MKQMQREGFQCFFMRDKQEVRENFKGKYKVDAKFGWYRSTTRFALPVYNSNTGEFDRFNVFRIEMLIRHAADGNLYLYDMANIKKKRAPRLSNSYTVTTPFLILNNILKRKEYQ